RNCAPISRALPKSRATDFAGATWTACSLQCDRALESSLRRAAEEQPFLRHIVDDTHDLCSDLGNGFARRFTRREHHRDRATNRRVDNLGRLQVLRFHFCGHGMEWE